MWRWLAAAGLVVVTIDGVQRSLPTGELRDFGSFVASADAAVRGENPYGVHPLTFHVVLPGFEVWNPNLNPPLSVLLFRPLLASPPQQMFRWWWGISLVSYLLTVALLVHHRRRSDAWLLGLWALSLAGFWDTLALGQIYLPLVLAATVAWYLLQAGWSAAAGLLIGVVIAVKPNFAVWPALLLLAGHRRAPLTAFTIALALAAAPLIAHGARIYEQWFAVLLADEHRVAFLTNASLSGLASRLGHISAGPIVSAALLIVAGVWTVRHRPSAMQASAAGILLGIAASPIAWVHYTLFLLPVFFTARMSPPLIAAATLLVVPVAVVLRFLDAPAWQQLTIGSTYNWAVVLGLFAIMPIAAPDVSRGLAELAAILRPSRRAACRSELSR